MFAIIVGILIVVWAFVWMGICASAGWSDAWWYFDWAQYKFVLLVQLLVGGLFIGYGLRSRSRRRGSS